MTTVLVRRTVCWNLEQCREGLEFIAVGPNNRKIGTNHEYLAFQSILRAVKNNRQNREQLFDVCQLLLKITDLLMRYYSLLLFPFKQTFKYL